MVNINTVLITVEITDYIDNIKEKIFSHSIYGKYDKVDNLIVNYILNNLLLDIIVSYLPYSKPSNVIFTILERISGMMYIENEIYLELEELLMSLSNEIDSIINSIMDQLPYNYEIYSYRILNYNVKYITIIGLQSN